MCIGARSVRPCPFVRRALVRLSRSRFVISYLRRVAVTSRNRLSSYNIGVDSRRLCLAVRGALSHGSLAFTPPPPPPAETH